MDFKQILLVPIRRYKEILVIIGVFLISFLLFASQKAPSYPVTLFYTISLNDTQETTDFKYSNFYAEQSGLEFTRTVSGWFDDPLLEDSVFQMAKIDKDSELGIIKKLMGFFRMKRIERQNIQINFDTSKDEYSHKIADSLTEVIKQRLIEYNLGSNSNYKLVLSSKWVEKKEVSFPLYIFISLILGLIFGVLFIFFYEYLAGKISTIEEAEEIFGKENIDSIRMKNFPSEFILKFMEDNSISNIVGVGFLPDDKLFKKYRNFSFPLDLNKIETKKHSLVIAILGFSKSDDLKRISKIIEQEKRELVVIY